VLGDFNHDGKPDFAGSNGQLSLGNGDGTFQPAVTFPPQSQFISWIAAGDVNNDGWTDIIAAETTYLVLFLNDQHGGFTESIVASVSGGVTLADLNGDGNLDVVVASQGSHESTVATVLLGDGQGGFAGSQGNIPYPFENSGVPQVGDVNGDGIPDLLLPADGSIGIALGTGKGTFLKPFAVGAGPGLGQVLLQNLHGQSPTADLPDLVAPDSTGGVTVLLNLTR
jgi:FG-GAP-like repeat